MIRASQTFVGCTGDMQKIGIDRTVPETVLTTHKFVDVQMFPVRLSSSADVVKLLVDTQLLSRQRMTEEANESIRRRLHN